MLDRHARERAKYDQWRASMSEQVDMSRQARMLEERQALVGLSFALDILDGCDGWNAEFRQTVRVYVAMYCAMLDGLIPEEEWDEIRGHTI